MHGYDKAPINVPASAGTFVSSLLQCFGGGGLVPILDGVRSAVLANVHIGPAYAIACLQKVSEDARPLPGLARVNVNPHDHMGGDDIVSMFSPCNKSHDRCIVGLQRGSLRSAPGQLDFNTGFVLGVIPLRDGGLHHLQP